MIRLEQRGAVAFTCMAIAVVVILPTNLRALLRAHIGLPCPYCTKPMLKPTRDHIRPVRYGGSLTDQNKVIVCEPCNHDRGHHTLTDWARHLRRDGDPRAATVTAFERKPFSVLRMTLAASQRALSVSGKSRRMNGPRLSFRSSEDWMMSSQASSMLTVSMASSHS